MRRLLVPLVLFVLTACSGVPAEDAGGAEIYGQLCARCHAANLSGGVGPALGPDSGAARLTDEQVTGIVARGRGSGMPAFGNTLSEAQLGRLVAYLREQQAG